MILTVFGIVLLAGLAPFVLGAIVLYWKKVLIAVGVLLILFLGLLTWADYESRRANDAYNAAHPEEYRRLADPDYWERKQLVERISLAVHHWRDNGEQIPYKKGPRDPGDFEIVDGVNHMTQTRSDLETFDEALEKVSLDSLRTLKVVLPSAQWEADYSIRVPAPVSIPSPQPKIHRTQPQTWFVQK
jgi:hypothetical protein